MTARRSIAANTLVLLLAAAAMPAPARAQSKADAFAGRIPPISGQLYRKAGRLEMTLGFNPSLADAFFNKYFGGVKLGYHIAESFSVGVHGMGGSSNASASAVLCSRTAGCGGARDDMLLQVPGQIRWIAGAEVAWAPVYGKLSVVAEKVAHFDLSIIAGVDAVAHDQIYSREDAPLLVGSAPVETAIGGHVGLGARIFIAQWLALRLELKDYVYPAKVPNIAADPTDWQHQVFTELGLSFFIPPHNRATR